MPPVWAWLFIGAIAPILGTLVFVELRSISTPGIILILSIIHSNVPEKTLLIPAHTELNTPDMTFIHPQSLIDAFKSSQ